MRFFLVRLLIFVFLISLQVVTAYGLKPLQSSAMGVVFTVAWCSVLALITYFIVLFIVSASASLITASNCFSLSFRMVSVADIMFCHAFILAMAWLFLTEAESSFSAYAYQGVLVEGGLKTVLGWRMAAENAKSAISLAIALHFLFFIHNCVATRPAGKGP